MVVERTLASLSTAQAAVLEQPKRDRIFTWLEYRPGSNRNQLASGLGLFYNSVKYHLDCLLDHGLVVQRESVKDDLVFFRGEDRGLWDDVNTRVLYGRSPTREVALWVHENPGAVAPGISEALDTSVSSVRVHLRCLKEYELVECVPLDGWETFHPAASLVEWVEGPGQGFLEPVPLEEEALVL